jgi:hypothetical protein
MKILKFVLPVAVLALVSVRAAKAVPVVPNFTQGSMTSHTETTSTVTETINSIDYNTGYQYSVTGTNITPSSGLSPSTTTSSTNSLNGVTSTWTGLNMGSRPTWSLTTPGQAFQFTESYQGPGLSNQTIIQRTTEIRSVTDTTSIFMQ